MPQLRKVISVTFTPQNEGFLPEIKVFWVRFYSRDDHSDVHSQQKRMQKREPYESGRTHFPAYRMVSESEM